MIEQLSELARGTCRHCGGVIVQYAGDLTGVRWSHDATGKAECPSSTYAEPGAPAADVREEDEGLRAAQVLYDGLAGYYEGDDTWALALNLAAALGAATVGARPEREADQ